MLPEMPGEHVVHAVGVVHAADAERRNPKQYVTRSSHHHLQQLFGLQGIVGLLRDTLGMHNVVVQERKCKSYLAPVLYSGADLNQAQTQGHPQRWRSSAEAGMQGQQRNSPA